MSEFLVFILPPLAACLILISITCYFGIHVIKREIIFIDIALAQIAALGVTIAEVILPNQSHEGGLNSQFAYVLSLGLVLLASFLFAYLKSNKIRIPLEALIGIAFAVATTASVIILDKSAGSDVHIHDMMIGSVLWVTWPQVIRILAFTLMIGLIHWVLRKKMMTLTEQYNQKARSQKNPVLWDFVFYATFGILIIESVHLAGILTVFAFLIIPASISLLLFSRWDYRILAGLVAGILSILPGLYFAWAHDLPASPLIIGIMAAILIVVSIYVRFNRSF